MNEYKQIYTSSLFTAIFRKSIVFSNINIVLFEK